MKGDLESPQTTKFAEAMAKASRIHTANPGDLIILGKHFVHRSSPNTEFEGQANFLAELREPEALD